MCVCACVSKISAYTKRHQGKQIAAACRESAIAAAKRLRIILQCGTSLCHTCRMLRVQSPHGIALLSIRRSNRYWYIYTHICVYLYMCLCFCRCLCCTIYFTACNEIASHIAYTIRCRWRQQFSEAYVNIQMYLDTMWHACARAGMSTFFQTHLSLRFFSSLKTNLLILLTGNLFFCIA